MSIYCDAIEAEREASRLSLDHGKPIAVVWHSQIYRHVAMSVAAARVCIDNGTAIASQSFVCDSGYVFQWGDYDER